MVNKEKENRKFCVYKHTSPSGKCYIGITCRNPIKRWSKNGRGYYGKTKKSCKYNHPYFVHAIDKYGWNNFTHEILFTDLGELQAKLIERSFIRFYKNQNLSYNVTDGGDGVLGVKHQAWNKGIKTPEEKKRKDFKLTEEHKQKLSIAHKGKAVWPPARAVNLYTADGQYLDTFERCSDLARYLNVLPSNVNQVVLGRVSIVRGCQARYVDDELPLFTVDYYTQLSSDPVELIDLNDSKVYIFPTIYAASRYTGIKNQFLLNAANGKIKQTNGVVCKFLSNTRLGKSNKNKNLVRGNQNNNNSNE